METTLPEVTKQMVLHIDGTPDENYPLRILQAYRDNCDSMWASSVDGTCDNPIYALMNEHQRQRAEILDEAIAKLKCL